MNKKKLLGYVLTGVLSVGVIGGVGTSAFAANTSQTAKVKYNVETLDAATQEKVQKIKDELKNQLAKLGVTLPERSEKGDQLANLDEATKAKVEAIFEKEKAGTITHEEAKTQLKALGVNISERGGKGKFENLFANLDEATKAKAEAIFEKEKAGTITHEEAKTQLKTLGVNIPERGGKGKLDNLLTNLDEATKAKAEAVFEKEKAGTITHEEAETQLKALGVNIPERGGKGKLDNLLTNLDEATKAKAEAIFEKEKSGTINHEEAETQLKALGVDFPEHGGKGKFENLLTNLDAATKAKAQELIDTANAELEKLGVKHNNFKK
ncbi:hypothetical protein ACFSO7_23880 [Bacillus sp. CGMCC 1.16607]|uniref:hypothetical protein n=1 Tax=Bacillus sp. CGMCC 1.16607 TaxID=3351842 RepID=UPI00363A3086